MSTSLNDEELELLDDFRDEASSNEDEQEQELLRRHNDEQNWAAVGPARRSRWRLFVALVAGLALLLVCISLVIHSGRKTSKVTTNAVEEGLDVQRPSYEVGVNWDYGAPPQRREYDFTIRDQEHNPDGIYRPMILVNNQFPGPLIEANEGDTISVRVNNRAVNATSIHWHGMYQNGTSHMDGTVGVSQCPIAPGGQFTYEFKVSEQSGTYWWHAHQGVQSSDGLHGPLIIHGRNDKVPQQLDYASDRVVMLSDHYHDISSALLWQYLKPDMENAEPVPQSGLINGQGVRNCDLFSGRRCDNRTSHVKLEDFSLQRGAQHRLRLINVGAFAELQFQVDEHELFVTEVDGTDVEPSSYHRLNINPAQRYSVVIKSDQANADSYWMRARMITRCFTDPPKTLNAEVRAIVRYVEGSQHPQSKDWEEMLQSECRDMNTTDLIPVERIAAPAKPDAFFYLRSNFEIGAYRLSRGFFNTSSWRPNVREPSLSRLKAGLDTNNKSFTASARQESSVWMNDMAFDASRELTIQTEGIQTIDILVSNFDDGNHPLHLHGYKYFVLAQGHGHPPLTRVDAGINVDSLEPLYRTLDLSNPLRRDTASVEAFGWILIRIVADNPGAWLLHCHISWHSEAGLAMQLLTRTDQLDSSGISPEHAALCAADGLERGTAPHDEDYRDIAK